ncbi:ROK family protein [Acidicapsa dinghuensis]|uniref:ROK family protein n=1 Tax=Acidicapsa dinghuensis TaxID=2218256 RepID=A0ABW1EJ45_9BACT|nr:ROK family protein [Acidicapsa dinghuensis]
MNHPQQFVLVYDVGGSHISAAVCESESFRLRGLSQAPLPSEGSGHISAASFGRLIHTLGETAAASAQIPLSNISGASLAMPGPFDYENGISQMKHKLPALFGVDLKSALATRFGWQPSALRFVNDAAAFLLGEMGAGAARGFDRAIGITLGTGIGCAFGIHNDKGSHIAIPSDQPNGDPGVPPGGEIWNLPYNNATVEDFVSTRFLRGQYQVFTGVEAEVSAIADKAKGDHPCPEPPAILPPEDPFAAHCRAREAFRDFGRHLGLALDQHCAAFHPDVIVFGGGISRAHHLFLPAARRAMTGIHAELVISRLMDEAPLTGAGVRWFTAQAMA